VRVRARGGRERERGCVCACVCMCVCVENILSKACNDSDSAFCIVCGRACVRVRACMCVVYVFVHVCVNAVVRAERQALHCADFLFVIRSV